jgi:small subunit ribosomal protein S18
MSDKIEEKPKKFNKRPAKKKVCLFCQNKDEKIDYKDINKIKRFITEKGKIIPRRQTGVCSYHQRELAEAIKRARTMALLPFLAD